MSYPSYNFANCTLCPRNCNADRRSSNSTISSDGVTHTFCGYCGQSDEISLARAALHFWEEPCISGVNGSGAVFFCGCNLKCVFCQNNSLANSLVGKSISVDRLTDIFLELQNQNAHNINLVTPGHFVPQIARALESAKNRGLSIPVVYNTGSYEYANTIRMLDGLVDIYMPDLKYMDSTLSTRLSNAPDYFIHASEAIYEMYRQTGPAIIETLNRDNIAATFETDDIVLMKKGVLVRHLVLPKHTKDSRNILKYLHETYSDNIFISIMNQYTPMPRIAELAQDFPELQNTLSSKAYDKVVDYAISLGITNAFIQEGETCKESFIPIWDYTGV